MIAVEKQKQKAISVNVLLFGMFSKVAPPKVLCTVPYAGQALNK